MPRPWNQNPGASTCTGAQSPDIAVAHCDCERSWTNSTKLRSSQSRIIGTPPVRHNLPSRVIGPVAQSHANKRGPRIHFNEQAAIGAAAEKFQVYPLLFIGIDPEAGKSGCVVLLDFSLCVPAILVRYPVRDIIEKLKSFLLIGRSHRTYLRHAQIVTDWNCCM